jgi:hypothetical protein
MTRPVERILARLPQAKSRPSGGWSSKCPAHDGQGETSLSINEGDGARALLKCFAGCLPEQIVAALGLTMADLFERRDGQPQKVTLAELARAKHLPAKWLVQTLGWHDLPGGGVGIPYRDELGHPLHVKRRTALEARRGSYWPKGTPLMPYGLESLAEARQAGYLILVEGETDRATLRYHGLPALGIPGASNAKVLEHGHVEGLPTVYVWQEPATGGRTFVRGISKRLVAELGYAGNVKVVRIEGVKDPSALHIRDPEGFEAAIQQAMAAAQDLPPPDASISSDGDGKSDDDDEPKAPRKSQATLLVELVKDVALWHTPEQDAYATLAIDSHHEHWPLKTKAVRLWLRRMFYDATGKTPASQAVQDALGVLEGKAQFDGAEHAVYTRLAEHDGRIYLDLANARWEAVEITATGWRVVAEPPVKFRRAKGMLPLPYPVAGGTMGALRSLLNVEDKAAWTLMQAWLVQALRPTGPYPVLVLHGEQGSAKSTTCRLLRALVDPNSAPLRAEPRDNRDLIIAATNGWVIGLDNLSHLSPWLSDAICRLATGGGFATRELYTDAEEVIFDAQRPGILNGIEELATRGDLLDRSIILYLPAIPENKRKPEAVLWQDFERMRPSILGAMLGAVSTALAKVATVKLNQLPRMADFALWAVAVAPKLDYSRKTFLAAYAGNRDAAHELALDAALIVAPLRDLLEDRGGTWDGTATVLLHDLSDKADERTRKAKGWPSNGRGLSNALRRIAPNLRAVGIDITFPRGHRKGRLFTIEQLRNFASPSSSARENQAATWGRTGDANAGGDAKSVGGDDGGTQDRPHLISDRQKQGDARDDGDAKKPMTSSRHREEWPFPRRA